jgi:cysteinyl-tRNA synthetase
MAEIYLTNSLTRKKEKFVPIEKGKATMYSCGPTVYQYVSIGNFRTYITADTLLRVLKFNGYKVSYVMNITDVGHLTGDNLGDADTGEDRMEKAARSEGKTARDIADYYTKVFLEDYEKLNLVKPEVFAKATDHINEQIALVKKLEDNGLTYKTSDGIYFDTKAYEKKTGSEYGELSTMDKIKEGARVEANPEKKDARDFALWKFSETPGVRQMEWESPWGLGFPGWHIECSAMSMKYLGDHFDIHTGGEDLKQTHHPNEIAQAEGATGEKFVDYWIHTTFLKVDGKKMSKSLGNVYTVGDLQKKEYEPLALRYLYLTANYRDSLNFTWKSLESAQTTLLKLYETAKFLRSSKTRTVLSKEKQKKVDEYSKEFNKAVNDDLNTPKALSVVWKAVKSNIPSEDKYDLLMNFDEVLGLRIAENAVAEEIPAEIKKLIEERNKLRDKGEFDKADKLRAELTKKGYQLDDTPEGVRIKKI